MALLSDEEFNRLVASLESRGFELRPRTQAQTTPPGPTRVFLDEKHFRRIEKFTGEPGKWEEWLFALCVAVGSVATDCVVAMEAVVQKAATTADLTAVAGIVEEEKRTKYSAELFSVLCSLTGGEASVVVRSVIQKGAG